MIEYTHVRGNVAEKIDIMKDKVVDVKNKIDDTKNNYLYSVMQTERIKKILKICDDNKKQNEEYIAYFQ